MIVIKDGRTGDTAKVGADNRLQVRAITEEEVVHAGENGKSYNFNTGLISVSADSTLIYLKNNSSENFIISSLAFALFGGITYTSASLPYMTIIKNPTAGDLITDATVIDMQENRNFGSTKTFTGDLFKGKSSGTITGGNEVGILQVSGSGRSFFSISLLIPKGSSIALKLTSNLSSGSANCYAALIGYYKDNEDI